MGYIYYLVGYKL